MIVRTEYCICIIATIILKCDLHYLIDEHAFMSSVCGLYDGMTAYQSPLEIFLRMKQLVCVFQPEHRYTFSGNLKSTKV